MTTRPASVRDAAGIAEVHVASWQAAYRGLLPQEYLDGLDVARRTELWQRLLTEERPPARTFVAEPGRRVVGFSTVSASRDDDSRGFRLTEVRYRRALR